MIDWIDFELPNDWNAKPIKDIAATMRSGGTPRRNNPEFWEGDIPFALIEDITSSGTYLTNTNEKISQAGLANSSAWLVPKGAVLLTMYATIGATAVNAMPLATNQAILAIVPKPEYSSEFLAYSLNAHKTALSARNVQATQKNINKGIVESFLIPVPPIAEQLRIAHVLSTVQTAIEQQERLIVLTRELKSALMNKLFTEGFRGEKQKETEIGLVPESWEVVPFSDSVDIKTGQVDPRIEPFSQLIHVGPENIERDTGRLISLKTNQELGIKSGNYLFTPDDILYSKIRPYLNKVALPEFDGTCSADMYPLRPNNESFTRNFLFQLLLSDVFKVQAISHQDRTGIPKINRNQLGSTLLPKPPVDEQVAIADSLSALDSKISLTEQKTHLLEELFRCLLHQLMTGQIRVNDIELPGLN